ncbi:hypothetical protein ACO0LB_04965 [Undibacterium sp. SXout7W]|uniref:hypothetical protein n=1 Tax=Undibacterium sp. SXout7W TaxID=3413049 RepID=UPI003BF210A6
MTMKAVRDYSGAGKELCPSLDNKESQPSWDDVVSVVIGKAAHMIHKMHKMHKMHQLMAAKTTLITWMGVVPG